MSKTDLLKHRPTIVLAGTLACALVVWLAPALAEESEETQKKAQPVMVQAEDREIQVVADDIQYLKAERKIVATGNVLVVENEIELSADRAEVQIDTKDAEAQGHVIVRERGKAMISGDEAYFNFDTSQGSFPNGRFYQYPWYGKGDELIQEKRNVIKAENVLITSCNLPETHYDLKAGSATFYPGDKVIAKNVTFRILGVPVFWWPYLIIPLNRPLGNLSPGYSDEWGGYIQTAKGFSINENIRGRLLFDWYSKRGFGFGAEVDYEFKRLGTGQVKLYGIRDDDAPDQRDEDPFQDESRSEEDRGRVSWKHKARLDPYTTMQVQWHELSDEFFLQDFFESEHREEIDPQSFVTLTRNATTYSLLANIEKRTNRFQSVGEKLPEIIFTWLRKPLFDTNFYYTNQEGFVNFTETASFSPDVSRTIQFFTDHELSYPMRFFQHYNFIPFMNFREDVYSKGKTKEEKLSRYAFGLGFESSTRFFKTWDYTGDFMGIELNGVRHIIEPSVEYNSIKLASVEPTRIISTGRGDDIDHQDIITFGVENRIQTKQILGDGELQRVDLVSFNTFLDYSFGPGSDLLVTPSNKFIEGRVEIVLRPYDWFQLREEAAWSFNSHKFLSNNLDAVFTKGKWDLLFSHRLEGVGTVSEDSQVTIDITYDVNERWDVGTYFRWESFDNEIEEWEIRAERDLHDFILEFGFNVRDSERADDDHELNKEAFVELQLKAIEDIKIKTGHRATFSSPRIGRTVSGVNEGPPTESIYPGGDPHHIGFSTP
jgi:hypothetical protein